MSQTTTADLKPACWCTYGREGLELIHPGCPEHDPENTPAQETGGEPIECETCADGWEDCGNCDGSGEDMYGGTDEGCDRCGGRGEIIPDHCCACGGSPYCQCCPKCGSPNAGHCACPITVQRADGTTRELT